MSLWKVFRYVFGVFVAFMVATLTSTQVDREASCPPSNCTYGKDVRVATTSTRWWAA